MALEKKEVYVSVNVVLPLRMLCFSALTFFESSSITILVNLTQIKSSDLPIKTLNDSCGIVTRQWHSHHSVF